MLIKFADRQFEPTCRQSIMLLSFDKYHENYDDIAQVMQHALICCADVRHMHEVCTCKALPKHL
ncbi:hypothetical protein ACFOET_17035 [Parapedobacter deserti]|uniref:Uncharacterized protein n=1 Tax=Parapedobacter deserti TaxID=1912957 RepID=A0ABV7JQT1_9SPHI